MGEVIQFPKTPKPTAKRGRSSANAVAVNWMRPDSLSGFAMWDVKGRPDLVRYEIVVPRGAGAEGIASLLGIKVPQRKRRAPAAS
jgi:hypothetical protein